jgi:EmrB/QacA subfamily drug resistance transporter
LEQDSTGQGRLQTATGNKTVILIAISAAYFVAGFMTSGLNVALPSISRDYQASALVLSWIPTAYLLPTAVLLLLFGRISDMLGIKKVFVSGMILFSIAGLAAAFSISIEMLIACRVIQGIAGAAIWGNSQSMITAAYPAQERGRALGINVACFSFSFSSGPFLGGILTEHLGWRAIFWFVIPISVGIIMLIVTNVKGDWRESKGEKLDYKGSAIYGFSLIALIMGFSELPGISGIISICLGIIGLIFFVKWEIRTRSPILDIKVFRSNRVFIFSNLAALMAYCATFSMLFLISLYLQYINGLGPFQAGLVLMAMPVMQAIVSPIAGRLSDKVNPHIVVTVGLAITCLGILSFVLLGSDTSLVQIIISLLVIGMGMALFQSPNMNATMSSVNAKYYSTASAVTVTMRTVGQTLSMGITMTVLAILIGGAVISPEHHAAFLTSTRIIFAINAVLCLIGALVSHVRGSIR